MRILPILALAALTPSTAPACGFVAPQLMQLSTHETPTGARTFALGAPAPETYMEPTFTPIAPRSYDATAVARSSSKALPKQLTLVGPGGARPAAPLGHVLVRDWGAPEVDAIELDPVRRGDAIVAVVGEHTGLAWTRLDAERTDESTPAWLAAQHEDASPVVYVQRIHGTDLDVVTTFGKAGALTLVRRGDDAIVRVEGVAQGALDADGIRWLVVSTKTGLRARYLAYDAGRS